MLIFLHVFCAAIASVASNPTVYDQRQSGKTNVRVEVKDAVIIAVGDGEFGGDYDYSYDYSDLTIKPEKPSTSTQVPITSTEAPPKSTTRKATTISAVTAKVNATQNGAIFFEAQNNSIIFATNKPANASKEPLKTTLVHQTEHIPVVVVQDVQAKRPNKFLPVKTVEKHYVPSSQIRAKISNATAVNLQELPPRHCSPGFFLDNQNRCKRIRRPAKERPQLPIGLRFDHKPLVRS